MLDFYRRILKTAERCETDEQKAKCLAEALNQLTDDFCINTEIAIVIEKTIQFLKQVS